jgi:hypothetical protein
MNTSQMIIEIFGANYRKNFEFDSALPQITIDIVSNEIAEKIGIDKNKIYRDICCGSVYAYCRHTNRNGFLPLTFEALEVFRMFLELTKVNLVFTPILNNKQEV